MGSRLPVWAQPIRHGRISHHRILIWSHLIIASLAALVAAGHHAAARSVRTESLIETVQSRAAGEPVMAVVSLRDQRITV